MDTTTALTFEAPEIRELQQLLPDYEVRDFIAQGGMGAVYRAHFRRMDLEVAIKVLPREFSGDAGFRRQFEAEARAMGRLHHQNLLRVFDFGEVGGMAYIVMEYVNGKALHYSAYGVTVEQVEAARLMLGVCLGLAHAHDAGVLHCDIKPANILLDSTKCPKVGDFGLARMVGSVNDTMEAFGSPGYTAPEVMKQPELVSKQADVYSIGAVLYELLTGEAPEERPVPAGRKVAIDSRLDRILTRALHPLPAMRYSDAGVMAEDLAALVGQLEVSGVEGVVVGTAQCLPKPLPLQTPVPQRRTVRSGVRGGPSTLVRRPTLQSSAVGVNWPLVRNLVLIVTLVLAIFGMMGAIEQKKERLEQSVVPPFPSVVVEDPLAEM